jgi:hypothetical protein
MDYEQAISIADVHEIFLGLGYQPNDITISQLKDAFIVQQQKQSESAVVSSSASVSLTLSQVLDLFQSVSFKGTSVITQETSPQEALTHC